jgi:hypothetical protein
MELSYPAARAVAPILYKYFSECLDRARDRGALELAPRPDECTIERIINAGFWASLRREEGRSPRISLAFLAPEHAETPLLFSRPLGLDPATLTKLAPAVERPSIHLGVWHRDGELYVWGTTRTIPNSCFVLEVVEPGLLVVKRRRGHEGAKYANVAVLQGDQIKMIDQAGPEVAFELPAIASFLDFESRSSWTDPYNVIVQLAISMRAHGKGGSLLIVPHGSEQWRESIIRPIAYDVEPPFSEVRELLEDSPDQSSFAWREAFQKATDMVAGLTAVDGATVISDRYDLLAFGAKITRRPECALVEQVALSEPVVGSSVILMDPSAIGGTRHLSAAQFVHDQRDCYALIASQDGRFTAFAWPPGDPYVRAHRVDTLLI